MKPCPFCNAALNDNVAVTPNDSFCGACGRNAAAVLQAPTLPEGAVPFQQIPSSGFSQTGGAQTGGQQFGNTGTGPVIGVPPGTQQVGGQQFGNTGGGQQFGGQQQGVWPPPPGGQQFGVQGQAAPQGLNWGAFLAPFAWGPANKVNIGLLSLVGLIPIGITQLVSLGVSIYLLIKGNELAWNSRPWQSLQEFQAVQKQWVSWGLIIFVVLIVLAFMSAASRMRGAI